MLYLSLSHATLHKNFINIKPDLNKFLKKTTLYQNTTHNLQTSATQFFKEIIYFTTIISTLPKSNYLATHQQHK
jgi:hypothetical protein